MDKQFLFALCTIVVLLLSGCWDKTQTDDITFVSAIGLDEAKSGKVKITYLIVNPEFDTEAQSSSADTEPFNHVTFLADDFFIAKNIANTFVSKEFSYTILDSIFISEAFAKNEEMVQWMYDTTKDPEIRRDVDLVITEEKATTFLQQFKPKLEEKPYKYFLNKTKINEKAGIIPSNSELFYYFRTTEADNDLFLTTYASQGNDPHQSEEVETYTIEDIDVQGNIDKTQFLGAAVFKKGQMIGTLSGMETMLSTMINTNFRGPDYLLRTFPDPFHEDYTVTTKLNIMKRSKIKLDLNEEKPSIHVTLPITVDVKTNHSLVHYGKDKQKREKLKRHLEKSLEKDYNHLIKKTQEKFGSDPFGWSLLARKQFTTVQAFKSFNWMEQYPNMDINVNVDIRFGNFGRQSKVFDINKLEE